MRIALTLMCFALGMALPWGVRLWRARRWGLPVRLVVDPDDPQPRDIAGYFAEIARRLDAHPERMRLVICGQTHARRAIWLDFLPGGRMSVAVDGVGSQAFSLRRRWIPDHPVPLDLRRGRFYLEPVDGNRFRVMDRVPFRMPVGVYVLCTLLATVGIALVVPECLGAALGVACGGFFAGLPNCHVMARLWQCLTDRLPTI